MSSQPTPTDRNVILVVLDTVRKDYFDEYATRIQELSDTTFEQCRTASTWSVPSHASMFTGELPSRHGVHRESFNRQKTFADLRTETFLSSLSCRTIGLSANPYANSLFGFDQLFDEFQDFVTHDSIYPAGLSPSEYTEGLEGGPFATKARLIRASLAHPHPVRSLANVLGEWLDVASLTTPWPKLTDDSAKTITNTAVDHASTDEPFFMFVNYMDAHTPLQNMIHFDADLHSVPNTWCSDELNKWEVNKDGKGSEAYFERYRSLYGAAIDYLDRRIATLVSEIETRTDNETTIVITADHGHNLGYRADDGLIHHEGNISEGLLHVPLEIINPPAGYPDRVDKLFSQLSLGELIQALAAGRQWDSDLTAEQVPAEVVGLGGTGDPRDYREFESGEYAYWNRLIRCITRSKMKMVWDSLGTRTHYVLDPDRPCWQQQTHDEFDVDGLETAYFETAAADYKQHVARDDTTESVTDGAVEDRLRDLGYM